MLSVSRSEVERFESEETSRGSELLKKAGIETPPPSSHRKVRRRGGGFASGTIRNIHIVQNHLLRLAASAVNSKV